MKNIKLIISFLILSILFLLSLGFNVFQHTKIKRQEILIQENMDLLKQKEEILSKKDEEINTLKDDIEFYEQNPKLTVEERIEQKVQECMKKENYTTAGMSYCVYESEDEWNKQISKHLNGLKKVLTNEEYTLLLNSQKDWERYRNSQIKFIGKAYSNAKGTIYRNYAAGDIVGITEDRARYLHWASDIMKRR